MDGYVRIGTHLIRQSLVWSLVQTPDGIFDLHLTVLEIIAELKLLLMADNSNVALNQLFN